jgi:hypothetical protein
MRLGRPTPPFALTSLVHIEHQLHCCVKVLHVGVRLAMLLSGDAMVVF